MKKNIQYICPECSEEMRQKWQSENPNQKIVPGNYVKCAVKDGAKGEHMWFRVLACLSNRSYLCALENQPVLVNNVVYGQTMTITYDMIEGFSA